MFAIIPCIICQRPFLVVSVAVDVSGHVRKGGVQVRGQFLTEFLATFCVPIIILATPLQIRLVDFACGDGAAADRTIEPMTHTFFEEGNDRAVGCLILLPGSVDGLWLREFISVGDYGLQCLYAFLHDTFPLSIHLIQQLLILFFGRNDVGAINGDDTTIQPCTLITAKAWKPICAESENTCKRRRKSLLTLEFHVHIIASGQLFEDLQFVHGQERHVTGTSKTLTVK